MSAPAEVLLVDMGNTGIKWALCADAQVDFDVTRAASVEELLPQLDACAKVMVANVGANERVVELVDLAEARSVSVYQVHTQSEQLGIRCAYRNTANLGVDRWLAVLAARSLTEKPVAVIDAGTAITCDLVVGNRHMGGWIAPGLRVMRDALTANTTFVFADDDRPVHSAIGEDTPACVNQGCLAAAQGMLLSAERELSKYSKDFCVIISGGDQDCFIEMADSHIIFAKNIVLKGLQRLI